MMYCFGGVLTKTSATLLPVDTCILLKEILNAMTTHPHYPQEKENGFSEYRVKIVFFEKHTF